MDADRRPNLRAGRSLFHRPCGKLCHLCSGWGLMKYTPVREISDAYGINQLGNGFTQIIKGMPYGVKWGSTYARNGQGQMLIDETSCY